MVGVIGLAIFFALIAIGLPVGASLILVSVGGLGYLISMEASLARTAITTFSTIASYGIAVIPLFLLMSGIIFHTGLTSDLYQLAFRFLGYLRGGLALASVGGCAVMAALASSTLAATAPMAAVAIPEMKKYKYDPGLAAGCIAAGGTMGSLIPPSSAMIIYGIITEQSIAKLFAGGIIPGIIEAVFYLIVIYIVCTLNPKLGPRGPRFVFKEKMAAFVSCAAILMLIPFVLGGLFLGWFTPTEAGAAGASGAIIISILRRRLTWQAFKAALKMTIIITGMLYGLVVGARLFMFFMAVTTIPAVLASFVAGLPLSPLLIMAAMMMVYLILGCFMDAMAMILVTIPIFFPVAQTLGFSPIWFGVMLIMMMEISMITPPFGINVFTISTMSGTPVVTVYKGVMPFIVADIARVTLSLLVPGTILFLPGIIA